MTHSLEDLKSGKLLGSTYLKLACGLESFPEEILSLADTLEYLDLSDNHLSELPESVTHLKKLKILFFAKNDFEVFPTILSKLPVLSMVGFKSNRIMEVPENAFPPLLRWLVLTDNKIQKLPKSIGECHLLQKCALAGNQLESLPAEMANCRNLELLRISANQLKTIPAWLFELPKLSWIAFSGNPASFHNPPAEELETYDWDEFAISKKLGEGASGVISSAFWESKNEEVAVKIFKGEVTSDGLPADEMEAAIAAGAHQHLIAVLAKIKNHPEEKSGLVLKLVTDYFNLGNPPSLETCSRDVFDRDRILSAADVLKIAQGIAAVGAQLHSRGISHGDLYAHNILINDSADCLLGDFGAASFYDLQAKNAGNIERVEVRAFGCLLEDLVGLVPDEEQQSAIMTPLKGLVNACMTNVVKDRPSFAVLSQRLLAI